MQGSPGCSRGGRILEVAAALVVTAGCLVPAATDPAHAGGGGRGDPAGEAARAAPKRSVGASGLPIPAGGGVPRPAGAPANLVVLDWAGFKAAVSWTFDDSQPSHVAHYAALQAVGVPMTFYLNLNPGETGARWQPTWTQAVKDGHELGNHSVHHCHSNLTGCGSGRPLATLDEEIDACSAYIPAHFGQPATWTAAPPYGDHGYDEPARARFLVNRGVEPGMIGAGVGDHTDPFNLPIHMAASGETAGRFDRVTDVARAGGKWVIFLVHTITPTGAVWYNPISIADLTAAMAHGGALPDVWNDTVVAIGAYWRAQKLLASAAPWTAGNATTWTWTLPPHFPPGKFLRVKVDGGTLSQGGKPLAWDEHGYYEVALDAGALTLAP